MGRVTETLVAKILRQVEGEGLVLWFDPEAHYGDAVAAVEAAGVLVARYVDSYFALRAAIEPWLSSRERPRGVVYVPALEADGVYALCEACAAGVVMAPGAPSVLLNTRLTVVTRAAFGDTLAADVITGLLDQVAAGRLTLAELDQLAAKGAAASRSALTLVFDSAHPEEVALRFLASDGADARLVEKGLVGGLADLLRGAYGFAPAGAALASPAALRGSFARHLFGAEWRLRVEGSAEAGEVAAAVALLAAWRNRRDLIDAYVLHAADAERHLGTVPAGLSRDVLASTETFAGFDDALFMASEEALLGGEDPSVAAEAARQAMGRFWCFVDASRVERWSLLASIARVLRGAEQVGRAVAAAGDLDGAALAHRYADDAGGGAEPWCALDASHREMERRYHRFEADHHGPHDTLGRLIAKARRVQVAAATALAERFLSALMSAGFRLAGVARQVETFSRFVRPHLDAGRTAYLLVDGLRFEMARELYQQRAPSERAELRFTLGTLPSITSVGMAALLPGADQGAELVAVGDRLGLKIADRVLRDRKERVEHLKGVLSERVFDVRLGDLLPAKKATLEALSKARLVLVTVTDELDGLGERVNPSMARRLMDDVLVQLRRAVRVLFHSGIETVVVTADHGYLFGEALESGEAIPAPGGDTVDLHRRVWVGRGGATPAGCLRVPASQTGLRSDLELVVPWSLGCFVAGGGTAYCHGGASPQELIIPVVVLHGAATRAPAGESTEWSLTLGSARITTRFLSVQAAGRVTGLFRPEPRMVRVEVREGRKVLSRAVSAAQGFEASTGFVRMDVAEGGRAFGPNTVTLMLDDTPRGRRVRVVLIDVDTELELAALDGVEAVIAGF